MHQPRIAIVGDAGIDITLRTTGQPHEKVSADDGVRALGGTGANAAVAAVRLGSAVRLACTLGDDQVGAWVSKELAEAGVTAEISIRPGKTEVAVILIDGRRRRVIVDAGVAYDFSGVVPSRLASDADVTYVTHARPDFVLALGRSSSAPIVLGVESDDLSEDIDMWTQAISRATVTITNAAGEARLRATAGPDATFIVTRGIAGATLARGQTEVDVPAARVKVVDATGAGDCFAGALCHFVAAGRDLVDATRLAAIAASLSTRSLGAQSSLPSEGEVLDVAASGA